jgi:hypothetical protein
LNWILLASFSLASVLLPGPPFRDPSFPSEVGARVGFLGTYSKEDLHQAEVYWTHPLVGRGPGTSGWWVDVRASGSAGILWGAHEQGAVVALGPSMNLGKGNAPLALSLGIRPTVLSRHVFGRVDLGRELQFTSHIGVNLRLARNLGAGYHFQHMSNATLSGPNPGVDMHMIGFSVRF